METHSLSVCASTNLPVVGIEAVNAHCRRCDLHGVKIKAWKQQQPIRGRDERARKGSKEGHRGKETSPMFPWFPRGVSLKAAEKSSHDPPAHWFLIRSLVREPFLKLRVTNTHIIDEVLIDEAESGLVPVLGTDQDLLLWCWCVRTTAEPCRPASPLGYRRRDPPAQDGAAVSTERPCHWSPG